MRLKDGDARLLRETPQSYGRVLPSTDQQQAFLILIGSTTSKASGRKEGGEGKRRNEGGRKRRKHEVGGSVPFTTYTIIPLDRESVRLVRTVCRDQGAGTASVRDAPSQKESITSTQTGYRGITVMLSIVAHSTFWVYRLMLRLRRDDGMVAASHTDRCRDHTKQHDDTSKNNNSNRRTHHTPRASSHCASGGSSVYSSAGFCVTVIIASYRVELHDRHNAIVTPKVVRAVAPLYVPDFDRGVAASRRNQSSRTAESQKKREK